MKYRVEFFRPDGIFLGAMGEFSTREEATAAADDVPHFYDRRPGENYHHIVAYDPNPDYSKPCPRCGGSRAACGGPSDPHE